jgi:pantoate--beta-alanine ligase
MVPSVLGRAVEVREVCDAARRGGRTVGFVPTMGALHEGHLALVRAAKERAAFVVASIFVNPTQFGPSEDLARYPRDLDGDVAKLGSVGVDAVFAPAPAEIYPAGEQTRVRVGAVAEPLCGAFRPGHFEGVATVVAKLFGIVGPSVAVFGRKDYQQLLVIRRMARDLFLPVEVLSHPIVREADGLAMSSRNAYLSAEQRAKALALVHGLDAAARAFVRGERRARELERIAREPVARVASSIDYVEARADETLDAIANVGERALLAVACRIGATRLIDNVVLGADPPPLAPNSGGSSLPAGRQLR